MTPTGGPDADAVAELALHLADAIAGADATAPTVAAAAGGDVHDDGAPLGLRTRPDVPGVEAVTVTRRWDSEVPNAVEIILAPGLSLSDVEERLGAASPIPSSGPGDHVVVLEGRDSPATMFASLDGDDGVRAISVRRDS